MSSIQPIREILRQTLQIGSRADGFTSETPLLGSIPELDSMAVVAILTAIEERYGITIDDNDISAEIFATVGSLADFVAGKVGG
jgi:acyl carrier protein